MSSLTVRRLVVLVAVFALAAVVPWIAPSPAAAVGDEAHAAVMVDTATGIWYARDPLRGSATFFYGDPGDSPFLGDWDCDGIETPGLYRASDGFAYLRNSNTQGVADITFFFGDPNDIPLSGDFNGDGCDTLSVYRPSTSEVFVINELGADGGGLGAADFSFVFGDPGDIPFVGDFDGDGVDSIGLHRRSTGRVYFRNSLSAGNADFDYVYGDPRDVMVAGDWDGDGDDTLGVFRPLSFEFFYRDTNTPGYAEVTQDFVDAARRVFESKAPGASPPNLVVVAGATGFPGEVPFTDYPCVDLDDFANPDTVVATSPAPSAASDANGVLGMSYQEAGSCERFVITLGSFGDSVKPANTVPALVVVENFGVRNHVTLPGIVHVDADTGIDHYTGIDYRGSPDAFVVAEPGPSTDLYIDVSYFSNRFTSVRFLEDPARIVIDTTTAPTGTGIALGLNIGPTAVIRDNLDPDLISPGITAPFEVVGYGFFFEATGDITLRSAAASPGTGPLATATFSGTDFLGTVTGSGYATMASSSGPTWGEFSFNIDAIAPGEYELHVISQGIGDDDPNDPYGVYDTFLIVP